MYAKETEKYTIKIRQKFRFYRGILRKTNRFSKDNADNLKAEIIVSDAMDEKFSFWGYN